MSEQPVVRITRGAPTPDEEAAVNAAILKVWRDDVAAAAKGSGESPWVAAARAASLRTPLRRMPSEHAWSLSLRFDR